MAWNRKAPFNEKGELLSYAGYGGFRAPSNTHWHDADEIFKARMTFIKFSRGRSSALAHFRDEEGRRWPMFLSEAAEVFKCSLDGFINAEWKITKKGSNYSLKLHKIL